MEDLKEFAAIYFNQVSMTDTGKCAACNEGKDSSLCQCDVCAIKDCKCVCPIPNRKFNELLLTYYCDQLFITTKASHSNTSLCEVCNLLRERIRTAKNNYIAHPFKENTFVRVELIDRNTKDGIDSYSITEYIFDIITNKFIMHGNLYIYRIRIDKGIKNSISLICTIPYKSGKRHGTLIKYMPNSNGLIYSSWEYENGIINGTYTLYTQQIKNQLSITIQIKNNYVEGTYKKYHSPSLRNIVSYEFESKQSSPKVLKDLTVQELLTNEMDLMHDKSTYHRANYKINLLTPHNCICKFYHPNGDIKAQIHFGEYGKLNTNVEVPYILGSPERPSKKMIITPENRGKDITNVNLISYHDEGHQIEYDIKYRFNNNNFNYYYFQKLFVNYSIDIISWALKTNAFTYIFKCPEYPIYKYSPTGNIIYAKTIKKDLGTRLLIDYKLWYEDGTLKQESFLYHSKDYYTIDSDQYYKHFVSYHKNGNIHIECNYSIHHEYDGNYVKFDTNYNIDKLVIYDNGKIRRDIDVEDLDDL